MSVTNLEEVVSGAVAETRPTKKVLGQEEFEKVKRTKELPKV